MSEVNEGFHCWIVEYFSCLKRFKKMYTRGARTHSTRLKLIQRQQEPYWDKIEKYRGCSIYLTIGTCRSLNDRKVVVMF